MPKILLDAHMLGTRETGNESYIVNLARHLLSTEQSSIQVQLYTVQPTAVSWGDRDPQIFVDSKGGASLYRLLYGLPRACRKTNADLLHVTYHAPFWGATPQVVTVHDVSYRTRLRFTSPKNIFLQNLLGLSTILGTKAVITVSEFCRKEIERIYPTVKGRVHVTWEAPSPVYQPQPEWAVQEVKKALGIRTPYLLWVGKTQRRKNLLRLAAAFLRVQSRWPDITLVIAGPQVNEYAQHFKQVFASEIARGVIVMAGYVTEAQLSCLYTGCRAFVFPSLYEGFGLPVLEAMACGTPVITSNITALPEVAGDAALLIDPNSIEDIESAIDTLLSSEDIQASLRSAGRKRAATFSWECTAKQTLGIYEHVLSAIGNTIVR